MEHCPADGSPWSFFNAESTEAAQINNSAFSTPVPARSALKMP